MLNNKNQFSLSRYPVTRLSRLNRPIIVVLSFTFLLYAIHYTLYAVSYAQGEFVYDSQRKRNPFISLVTPDGRLLNLDEEKDANPLFVEGIIYDGHGLSYAIVDGEVRSTGDQVADYRVLRIEKNKVVFIKEGEILEVKLKGSNEDETYGTK